MNQHNCALAALFVSSTYIQQGAEAIATRQRLITSLLSQRRLPQEGWDDDTIMLFIKASQDSFAGDLSLAAVFNVPILHI